MKDVCLVIARYTDWRVKGCMVRAGWAMAHSTGSENWLDECISSWGGVYKGKGVGLEVKGQTFVCRTTFPQLSYKLHFYAKKSSYQTGSG